VKILDDDELRLHPIGRVHRSEILPDGKETRAQLATLVIDEELTECCDGLDEFSHLLVLWWAHERLEERYAERKIRPKRRADLPLVGLFCTRCPVRPNPIGVDIVQVVSVRGNKVLVRGLDAHDDTPVLDIKGWYGPVPSEPVKRPKWFDKLHPR